MTNGKTNLLVAHRQQFEVVVINDLEVAQVTLLHHLGHQCNKEWRRARRLQKADRGLCPRSRVHLRAKVVGHLARGVQALENGSKLSLDGGVRVQERANRELSRGGRRISTHKSIFACTSKQNFHGKEDALIVGKLREHIWRFKNESAVGCSAFPLQCRQWLQRTDANT